MQPFPFACLSPLFWPLPAECLHLSSRAQVAINWGAGRSGVTAPIFAVRSREQLDDVVGALDFTIPSAQMAALDEVSKVDLGFPQRWGDGDFFVCRGQEVEKRGFSGRI